MVKKGKTEAKMALEIGAKKIRQQQSNQKNLILNTFSSAKIISAGVQEGTTKADIREELKSVLEKSNVSIKERIDSKTLAALAQMSFGGCKTSENEMGLDF